MTQVESFLLATGRKLLLPAAAALQGRGGGAFKIPHTTVGDLNFSKGKKLNKFFRNSISVLAVTAGLYQCTGQTENSKLEQVLRILIISTVPTLKIRCKLSQTWWSSYFEN
jgi:hypothetical protein